MPIEVAARVTSSVAHTSISATVLYTVAMLACVLTLGHALSLDFPRGLLQAYVDLPWPFN